MFIECENCNFKYLVNSPDLKPNGRMVECSNCNHQWFQDLNDKDVIPSVPSLKKEKLQNNQTTDKNNYNNKYVKNLPSTIVNQEKPSVLNSIIVLVFIIFIFLVIWISRSFGNNTFVLIDFYINEFLFNLNLIISDLAKIFFNILN